MRKILSYCKSHIYDIHAILVGVILVLIIHLAQKAIYRFNYYWIDKKSGTNQRIDSRKNSMCRIYNLGGLMMLVIAAIIIFAILAQISPFVNFSLQSALMGCVYALSLEAFIKQIFPHTYVSSDEGERVV